MGRDLHFSFYEIACEIRIRTETIWRSFWKYKIMSRNRKKVLGVWKCIYFLQRLIYSILKSTFVDYKNSEGPLKKMDLWVKAKKWVKNKVYFKFVCLPKKDFSGFFLSLKVLKLAQVSIFVIWLKRKCFIHLRTRFM